MQKLGRVVGNQQRAALVVSVALATMSMAFGCDPDESSSVSGSGGEGGLGGESGNGGAKATGGKGNGGEAGSPTAGTPCPEPTGAGTVHDTYIIDADETWTAEDSPHHVPSGVAIRGATVTVEACAVVIIGEGKFIEVGDSVGDPAKLVAAGEIDGDTLRPVTFTSEAAGTYFGSLFVDQTGSLELTNTVVRRGGSVDTGTLNGAITTNGPLALPANKSVHVVNVSVLDSAGFGINLGDFTAFTATSEGLVIEGAGAEAPVGSVDTLYPLAVTTAALGSIPTGEYVNNARDAILVDAADRYPASVELHDRGVPYVSLGDFHVEPDGTNAIDFTVDAGVTVAFPADSRLSLGSSQSPVRVIAQGTAQSPIVFTSAETTPAAGDWVGIDWAGAPSGGNVFEFVRVEYAGGPSQISSFGCGPSDNDGALIITNWRPDDAFIEHSTFVDSAGAGIVSGWDSDMEGPDLTSNNTFEDVAGVCEVTQPELNGACPGADATPDCY